MTFHELYQTYSRDVYRFALSLAGNHAEADDITAETFARAWAGFDDLRLPTVKAFLFTIARNYFLKGLRTRGRQRDLTDDWVDERAGAEAEMAGKQGLSRVGEWLKRLPEIERTALLLRARDELSYEEIAAIQRTSLSAAKVRVHRARLKLAEWRYEEENR